MVRPFAALGLFSLLACSPLSGEEAEQSVAASPDLAGQVLYVANKRGASVSKIDLATGEEIGRAETCENPHELAVKPNGHDVVVACYSGTSVQTVLADGMGPVGEIELGDNARVHSALYLPDGRIIAGAEGRGSIFLIGAQTYPEQIEVEEIGGGGRGPHLLAVDANGQFAWGTIIPEGTVVRYDLVAKSEVTRRVLGGQTEAIALSPDGKSLWVGVNDQDKVYRLNADTLEIEAEITPGSVPIRLAMHPSGKFVVSSNFGSGDLSVIDTTTNRVVRTIPVSGSQGSVQVTLIFSPDGKRLYAAETANDTIAEIDFASGKVSRRLRAGAGGDGLAIMSTANGD